MGKEKKEEVKQAQGENQGEKVVSELHIRILENGGLQLDQPEGMKELEPFELEVVARNIYEQLRDSRIAQQALEMFKSRLG